jgi:hypothetical protein
MPHLFRKPFVVCLNLFLLCGLFPRAAGQTQRGGSTPALVALTRKSGYIFAGTVTAIERVAAGPNEVASLRITFHVDKAIRGVRAGQTLVVREWAGLWDSGQSYRSGERVVIFLYPLSKLGLTSAVGGTRGRFRLDRNGQVILDPLQFDDPRWRGKIRLSSGDFTRAIQRAVEE